MRDQHGHCIRAVPRDEAKRWTARIAARIRRRRQELDVSVMELAAALGVCDKTIHSWERGRTLIPTRELYRVATALGYRVIEILEDA